MDAQLLVKWKADLLAVELLQSVPWLLYVETLSQLVLKPVMIRTLWLEMDAQLLAKFKLAMLAVVHLQLAF